MYSRDCKDIIGGALVSATGLFATYHAVTHYALGKAVRMGPGMFPAAVGIIMAAFGLWIMIPALFRPGDAIVVNLRSILSLGGAIAVFALIGNRFGLVVGVVATVFVAALAEPNRNYVHVVLLAAAMVAFALLVFRIGLGVQIPIFPWSA